VCFLAEDIVLVATEAEAVAVHLALAKAVANFRILEPGESGEDTAFDFVANERWIAFTVSDGYADTIAAAPIASLLGNLLPPQQ
jgi:hypothetical protein